jgi:hypothetical protein
MSRLSATGTLCKGMPTATKNLYVLSCIESRDRGISDTVTKDPGKREPKQLECSMDFSRSKGGWPNVTYPLPKIKVFR